MGRSIQLDSDGNDITCMKEFNVLKNPCDVYDRENCEERITVLDSQKEK